MISGAQIRRARERLGETQARFATRFGVNQATIHRWEARGVPTRGTAEKAVERVLSEIDEEAAE